MENKNNGKKDPIIEGLESGRIYGLKCEALKTSPNNLRFCPDREICEVLSEYMEDISDMEKIIEGLYCYFCESKYWIFTGITEDGVLINATCSKVFAEGLNRTIDEKRNLKKKIIE